MYKDYFFHIRGLRFNKFTITFYVIDGDLSTVSIVARLGVVALYSIPFDPLEEKGTGFFEGGEAVEINRKAVVGEDCIMIRHWRGY